MRTEWLEHGDKNTKYFHTVTRIRRKVNKVEALIGGDGQWIYEADTLKGIAFTFYKKFKEEGSNQNRQGMLGKFNKIPKQYTELLNMEITKKGVRQSPT